MTEYTYERIDNGTIVHWYSVKGIPHAFYVPSVKQAYIWIAKRDKHPKKELKQ